MSTKETSTAIKTATETSGVATGTSTEILIPVVRTEDSTEIVSVNKIMVFPFESRNHDTGLWLQ